MEAIEPGAFVTFLRDRRNELLERWAQRVRDLPPASDLDKQALIDHMPQILDDIAAAAEAAIEGQERVHPSDDTDRHAVARLHQGYELGHVVNEYALLREVVLDLSTEVPNTVPAELRVFNRVLDEAITQAVQRFSVASDRMLKALDRISMLAFAGKSEDELLRTLLEIMLQASPGVDEVAILIRDGDRLRVRAAVGLSAGSEGFSQAIGVGFSGTIAAKREHQFVRSAETDPLVLAPIRGVKALYGVPLIDGPELIGVAHMGSATAYEFPDEDMLLFRAMANRASQLIIETRLKMQLAKQNRELDLVLESAALGSWSWEPGAEEVSWDARTRALFGFTRDEPLTYQKVMQRVPQPDRDRLQREIDQAIANNTEHHSHFRVELPGGDERFIAVRGSLVFVDGKQCFLGTMQDRTAEHYAERERELFLAALGHDLRSPLTAILAGSGSLLRSGTLSEGAARTVGRIANSSDRMARLIDQLLDFTRGRAGQPLHLDRRWLDLYTLWQQVLDEIHLSEPTRQVTLRRSGDTSGSWDPDRMLQVFQNLAWNAVHHGDSRPVTVRLTGDDRGVNVEIHNFGQPIPAELLPVLFDPFRRGKRGSGLGLGLYIAKQIVEAHGGTISVESSASAGTTFRVKMPR